jgi:hypothetical protein
MEETLLTGYEYIIKDGKTTEWHELRVNSAYVANPAPFIAELQRLLRRWSGLPGNTNPTNAAWTFDQDLVAVLTQYCVKWG